MREHRSVIITPITMVSAVAHMIVFTSGLVGYKKNAGDSGIAATGSTSCDSKSDLTVWRGNPSVRGSASKEAYSVIKRDAGLVKRYLEDNQVSKDEMMSGSVDISQKYASRYGDEGGYLGDKPDGYELTQTIAVSSYDIDKVKAISKGISALIEAGVELELNQPGYYYTKLGGTKLDLIEKAAVNAKKQVDTVVSGTGNIPGALLSTSLEVFQITARSSSSESYNYDRALDTNSWLKMTMITVWLDYDVQ